MRDNLPVSDLVTGARSGERQAWDALVERYDPLIWSICRRHGLGRTDTEDVRQAVWLYLVAHLGSLHAPAALPGWLATTTRRECLRVQRAGRPLAAGPALDAETLPDDQARRRTTSCWQPNAGRRCVTRSGTCRQAANG